MFLNEHQSKRLFEEAGIETPQGIMTDSAGIEGCLPPFDAPWFVKAQVLAGGRGKAGGVRRADDLAGLRDVAKDILGMRIGGHAVPFVRIEPATAIARECYVSFMVSRKRRELLFTASGSGGVEVESGQGALVRAVPLTGEMPEHVIRSAFFCTGVGREHWAGFREFVLRLHGAVRDYGLLLAEVNPLVLTGDGRWLALDGKVEVDDNVVDIRPDLLRFHTPEHLAPEENAAREAGLSYVELKGWVGLLVNGAGLAMATMDLLNFSGLAAANFMDLGGAADVPRMRRALELLFGNPQVRVVCVNLFGGIVSCAAVAGALVEALGDGRAAKPVVVRMDGFEAAEGRQLLERRAHPDVHVARDIDHALDLLRHLRPADAPDIVFTPGTEKPVPRIHGGAAGTRRGTPHLGKGARVLVQGITGRSAQLHTRLMLDYGTNIVAGVTPFKGGQVTQGVPVYDSVHEACRQHDIDATILFVPAAFAADSLLEAVAEGIPWAVCITEGIPQKDMLRALRVARGARTRIIGPNTPGIIVPGACKVGIMPGNVFSPGPLAVFSRSGTLTYEAAARLSAAGIGQSLCAGVGGDPYIGSDFVSLCELVRDDEATQGVLVLGEVGGTAEEELAAWVRETAFPKPVVSFVAGRTAPPGRRLGHAGAILDEADGGIAGKVRALCDAGIAVCPDLGSLPAAVRQALR
ncbi:succinate--CoA ligase subunit alpha [Nitratidesulfovibrio vulgaris]|uniref:Succinate--CoA ligase [ADP-forming] subunit alpha n=1 Tax=Nitratidesulfovibrio vulgaris (strain DP4) TaxID=391774 RepID=A0A0H3A7V4_NITV4|nr:succinate--CoA ligase subunit alpha [Nitratidesulfovibrio vulgaris]ABM28115.1 succinyl-CoA synthetase (ADP-forming) beta subunit / succinyl-CoA synthetase (ADP-forming) alpha subunit [Nitratidesulfovibrio vulgaris DP4]WCB45657.1 succinate--CoA ligase subunit alpha [Nitratidesulfovibrio vulgaris]